MEIKGLGVLVTGGGSGLGEATARMFAAKDAQVAILDLAKSNGAALAKELGGKAFFAETDVTNSSQVQAAIDQAVASFGAIHVVVNCAGIGTAGKTLGKDNVPLDLDVFRRVIEINLIGTFNVIRLAAVKMVANEPNSEGERGVFINTASVAAYEGQIGQPAYSASKGGVVSMTLPIAREFAREGIRCVTIAPGLFETPMLMGLPEAARQSLGASVPFPARLGRPAEYASLACYIV
ncbi:MAG TPA: SDR family NAD(P)-dependent oxidoreductase, partial [Methylomirabilota bacterium]|nr:SDR family NAD(P)-dependent oxidoreductase [Methylomirabilota bacterium]